MTEPDVIFLNERNTVLRIPFLKDWVPPNGLALKVLDLHVQIPSNESNPNLKLSAIDLLNEPSDSDSVKVWDSNGIQLNANVTKTPSFVNLYLFLRQSLEISKFKTSFKEPTYSNPTAITFTNRGDDPIALLNIETGHLAFQLGLDQSLPIVLNPKETFKLPLEFKPKTKGSYAAKLRIETNLLTNPVISYHLTGKWTDVKSYYKIIHGLRYDRELFEGAQNYVLKNKQNQMDLLGIQGFVKSSWDGHHITTAERRTIKYIWENYSWSPEARAWFNAHYRGLLIF